MKAVLQYATADSGPYKDGGTLRTKSGQDYKVEPLTSKDQQGNEITVGYRVAVRARALTLNTDFLTTDTWYFRLRFAETMQEIRLGQRQCRVTFDGQVQRNTIMQHDINIEFDITLAEYATLTAPVNLPLSEGGLVVEDSAVYIP